MARFVYTSSRAQQYHPIQDWTRFLRATRTFFPLHPGESHNIMLTLVQLMFSSSGTIRSSLLNSRYWSLHPAKVHLHPIPINNLSCTHTSAGCPWTCERDHPWNGDGVTNGTNAREECTSGKQQCLVLAICTSFDGEPPTQSYPVRFLALLLNPHSFIIAIGSNANAK